MTLLDYMMKMFQIAGRTDTENHNTWLYRMGMWDTIALVDGDKVDLELYEMRAIKIPNYNNALIFIVVGG